MNSSSNPKLPLCLEMRRRRQALNLLQADVAERLHVSPECITLWEGGLRRMELAKLPRIAAVLKMDARELCTKALAEFYPNVYEAIFGASTQLHQKSA